MLCQLCLEKVATHHLTERSSHGRLDEAHYCPECYAAKYLRPPPADRGFPWPRFTLKKIVILVGVWAIPNAVTAWIMRSGYVIGTPAQVRRWTIDAFLGVNLVLGFFLVWLTLLMWLVRVMWYKRTGGLIPMPERGLSPRQHAAQMVWLMPHLIWCAVVMSALDRRSHALFLAFIACAPMGLFLAFRLSKNPLLWDRIRQVWTKGSGLEIFLRTAAIAWSFGILLLVLMDGPSLMNWGLKTWFPIPPIALIWIIVQLGLMAAVAWSTRAR